MNRYVVALIVAIGVQFALPGMSAMAFAGESGAVCRLLREERKPAAYLIDAHGEVSTGPIDFGVYRYVFGNRDYVLVPTSYRVVVAPARIRTTDNSGWPLGGVGLVLEATHSVCPDSRTYFVAYSMVEAKSNSWPQAWQLPWKEDEAVDLPRMDDSNSSSGWAEIELRFDARVIGEIVDGTKLLSREAE